MGTLGHGGAARARRPDLRYIRIENATIDCEGARGEELSSRGELQLLRPAAPAAGPAAADTDTAKAAAAKAPRVAQGSRLDCQRPQ